MKIYTNNIGFRLMATVIGIGYGVVGLYALAVSEQAPSAMLVDRAFWLGVTFLVASVAAVAVTWLVADLSNIWCRAPRHWHKR